MNRQLAVFCIAAMLLAAGSAAAQKFEEIGDYRVHYNTLNTDLLPPDVAKAYGIRRSANRALLNIAVLRKASADDEMDSPVRARVAAHAINLTGQRRDIELTEILDDGAVYYVGTFRISNEETLNFTVVVQPVDSGQPAEEFSFSHRFFTN